VPGILWSVARYIETNPVRAGLVPQPEEYPWSSARAHLSGESDPVLTGSFFAEHARGDYADFVR